MDTSNSEMFNIDFLLKKKRRNDISPYWHLLSCQPRVTVTSCFVYKVIRDLESIYPQDRINTQVIDRFALAQVVCTS